MSSEFSFDLESVYFSNHPTLCGQMELHQLLRDAARSNDQEALTHN